MGGSPARQPSKVNMGAKLNVSLNLRSLDFEKFNMLKKLNRTESG